MKQLYSTSESLVNISNSILKYFKHKTFHPSSKKLDLYLEKNENRKICIILLDGFGKKIQERYKKEGSFILANKKFDITSVFPPTTVAATTALISGRYPCETGWLGWTQKFEEYQVPVTMFPSTFVQPPYIRTPVSSAKMCYFQDITTLLSETNKDKKFGIMHSFELSNPTPGGFIDELNATVEDYNFLYAYCVEPDTTLHQYGVGSKEAGEVISLLDNGVKNVISKHKDVLFILLADHGHLNVKYLDIKEHADWFDCLETKCFSVEPRSSAFFTKKGKAELFYELSKKYYGEHFYVLNKKEVKEKKVFGEGEEMPRFSYFIGDVLLIAKDQYTFWQDTSTPNLISHHAGSTNDEILINVSIYNSED